MNNLWTNYINKGWLTIILQFKPFSMQMSVHRGSQNKSHKNIFQTACDYAYVWQKIQVLECLNWKEAFSETWNQFGAEMLLFMQKKNRDSRQKESRLFLIADFDCWMVWLGNGDASHYGCRTRLLKSPVLSAHYRDCLIEPGQPKHSELTAANKGMRGKYTLYMSADILVLIKNKSKFPRCLYTHEATDLMIQLVVVLYSPLWRKKLPWALDKELILKWIKCIT